MIFLISKNTFKLKRLLHVHITSTKKPKEKNPLVDVFTKSVCGIQLESICTKLGLYDIYAPTWGGMLETKRIVSF